MKNRSIVEGVPPKIYPAILHSWHAPNAFSRHLSTLSSYLRKTGYAEAVRSEAHKARFTGLSLLDPSTKRLRPKHAMDYWSLKQIEQKTKEPEVEVVEVDPEPQPASNLHVLRSKSPHNLGTSWVES